ncbi:MAG: sporulation protein [Clostridia bacterium]|nr:sporulation protein [Clostridia bacterium]
MQEEKTGRTSHTLTLKSRKEIFLNEVEELIRFDEAAVLCRTSEGLLTVEGEGLRVTGFHATEGTLSLSGDISGLFYESGKKKPAIGLFGRAR